MRFRGFLRSLYKKLHSHILPSSYNAYRPHLLRKPWLLFFLTVTLTAETVFLANIVTHQSARNYLAAVLPAEVVELTNKERSYNSVEELARHPLLEMAAQAKAEDMAREGYFSHTGPDGKEPWAWIEEEGYLYASAGENLAVRFNESADVVRAWMESPGHRANIVKAGYTEIGVGVAEGVYQGAPATFVVQYFARPLGVRPPLPAPVVLTLPGTEPVSTVLAAATGQPVRDSLLRSIVKLGTEPSASALYVLAAVALLLIVLVVITFFKHIQVQPAEMLVGGSVIAIIAISFLALNITTLGASAELSQTAAIFNSAGNSVLVGEGGTTTETSEF
jgi:uncharacterized protein YkwD